MRWLAGRRAVGLADESHVIGTTNQLKAEYGALRPLTGILLALLSRLGSRRDAAFTAAR